MSERVIYLFHWFVSSLPQIPNMLWAQIFKCEEQKPESRRTRISYKYDSGISLASEEPRLLAQTADTFSIQKKTQRA